MTLTKTEINILKVFTGRITESFSILEVAKKLGQNYSIVHSSFQKLYRKNFLTTGKHKNYFLNYKENFSDLAYIESLKSKDFLKKHKTILLFIEDVLNKPGLNYFTLLVFGSYILKKQRKSSDIDILIIIPNLKQVEKTEILLESVASMFSTKFHINVVSIESVLEMMGKRDEKNIFNETLNNHIICFGAENYYKILSVR